MIPSQETGRNGDTLYCYTFTQAKEVAIYLHKGLSSDTVISKQSKAISERDSLIVSKIHEINLAEKEVSIANEEISNLENQVANREEAITVGKRKIFKLKAIAATQTIAIFILLIIL